MSQAVVLYTETCPSCRRFMDILGRSSAAGMVQAVDVATLGPQQLQGVRAVPAVVIPGQRPMYGTSAFKWLEKFETEAALESFEGENGALAYCEVSPEGFGSTGYVRGYDPF